MGGPSYRADVASASVNPRGCVGSVGAEADNRQRIYAGLHRWALSKQAPGLLRSWWSSQPLLPLVLFAVAFFTLLGAAPSGRKSAKQKAREIAARGITDTEHNEVLRLLLAMQSEYEEPGGGWS